MRSSRATYGRPRGTRPSHAAGSRPVPGCRSATTRCSRVTTRNSSCDCPSPATGGSPSTSSPRTVTPGEAVTTKTWRVRGASDPGPNARRSAWRHSGIGGTKATRHSSSTCSGSRGQRWSTPVARRRSSTGNLARLHVSRSARRRVSRTVRRRVSRTVRRRVSRTVRRRVSRTVRRRASRTARHRVSRTARHRVSRTARHRVSRTASHRVSRTARHRASRTARRCPVVRRPPRHPGHGR
jgi:hypothetical protein